MKIGVKLLVVIMGLTLTGIVALIGVTDFLAKREIEKLAQANIRNIALAQGRDIQNWIDTYMNTSRTLAQIMERFEDLEIGSRREVFDVLLRGVVQANPEILGVWTIWEPNALDGMDEAYANTPGSDASGRYIPWWVRSGGSIIVQACVEYEQADYYQYPLTTGKELITDPTYWDIEGKPTLMTDLVTPIKSRGRVVGTLGIDIEVSKVQSKVMAINPYPGSVAAVFSSQGTVVAHFDPERITKPMGETETLEAGSYIFPYMQAVLEGKPYFFRHRDTASKIDRFFTSLPFAIGNTENPWSLSIGVPVSVVMAPVYRVRIINSIIALGTMVLIALAAFFISRSISRPINYLAAMLKDISEGEGDLTKRVSITEKNELGDLAHYFNLTIEKIEHLVLDIKAEAYALTQIGADLASDMAETAASVNEITAHIKSVRVQTGRQEEHFKGTSAVMDRVMQYVDAVNRQIQKQAACMSQSSGDIAQMLANVDRVTQDLIRNGENVTRLDQASERGRSSLQEVSADMQEIARKSEGLLEITRAIKNLANQTNLLSMNAAIEAAHAGEAGKGFAVVAQEIHNLAASSSSQSKTISAVLDSIKSAIDKIIKATNGVLLNFEAINDGVKTVTTQDAAVRRAMEDQGAGSKGILKAIGELNEITHEVEQSVQGMMEASREVIAESRRLEGITVEIGNSIQEMSVGAEEIDTAVNRINDRSTENKQGIDALMQEVSRFKVP
ncbi:MAG: methyl-accepting chemotaxis protein [Spirochaetaceae bacterium]|jgi:methyl-accepting chemotaxis protein|nr:methyl-accepting chemotaxis protein [Spirochaetaceae bacterium]